MLKKHSVNQITGKNMLLYNSMQVLLKK